MTKGVKYRYIHETANPKEVAFRMSNLMLKWFTVSVDLMIMRRQVNTNDSIALYLTDY